MCAVDIPWTVTLVTFVVGILVGLTGVGAGALMTPILIGVYGVPIQVAIATDLIFATATKLVGVPFHHRQGSINWALTRKLWIGSLPGTVVGVAVVIFVASKEQTSWLTWPLAAVVLLTAVSLALRAIKGSDSANVVGPQRPLPVAVPAAGGFGIGLAVALTSVGAGALGMALLVRLSPPGVRPQQLVGTDLLHAIPIALIAGVAYGSTGLISWELLQWMLVGSLPGVVVGTLIAGRLPSRLIYGSLSAVLFLALVALLLR